jgi:uncharacterized protein YjdB
VRVATLGRMLLPALSVLLVSCEGGTSSDLGDQRVFVITVTPAQPIIAVGTTIQLQAVAQDVHGADVSGAAFVWSSYNELKATVSSTGLVTGVEVGDAIVDARIVGVAVTAGSANVRVDPAAAATSAENR